MKIYFAGAIRGGREKAEDYAKIVEKLQEIGTVLTTHVAAPTISAMGESHMKPEEIYDRDVKWLEEADVLVADVSIPSLGIGYEIAFAEKLGKRVICFYDKSASKSLSAMIEGNLNFELYKYSNVNEVLKKIEEILM